MRIALLDWEFEVDVDATRRHTLENSRDHCLCPYCRNYYETVEGTYPGLRPFLDRFGVNPMGPSEVMPFEPTLMLAAYRVTGRVLTWGRAPLNAGGVEISVEMAENGSFLLWAGEMWLPWVQKEDPEEVVSPANLPEFLRRMEEIWLLRHGEPGFFS